MTKTKLQFLPNCPLSKLKPYGRNPRKNEEAIDAVAKSIERFGAVAPIIVNKDFEICAGHTRFRAARENGEVTFPVIVAPHLTGDDFRGYNIADNQTATMAEWDMPELAAIVKELGDVEFPVEVLGFDPNVLDDIMGWLEGGTDGLRRIPKYKELSPDQRQRNIARCYGNVLKRRGKILADYCIACGSQEEIQLHHPDIKKKPHDVVPLCRQCHLNLHAEKAIMLQADCGCWFYIVCPYHSGETEAHEHSETSANETAERIT